MNAPLPSKLSMDLSEKLYAMDEATQQKLVGERGMSLPLSFEKKSFTVAGISGVSAFGAIALGLGGVIAAPIASVAVMGLLTASAVTFIGSAGLGAYYQLKNKSEQKSIKSEVLKQQYDIENKNYINTFASLNQYEFHQNFREAIYNDDIKNSIENSKIGNKVKASIQNLRNKVFGNNQSDIKNTI